MSDTLFCTCDHDFMNLIKANYQLVSVSIYYSNSILLIVHSFMENFSTSHCTESETHDVCVDYAMHGNFTDSLMPCNSSLISDNIRIYTNFMHASSDLPLLLNICLVCAHLCLCVSVCALCVCLCLCVCMSLCVSVSTCICASMYLCVSVCISVCACVSLNVSLDVCVCSIS